MATDATDAAASAPGMPQLDFSTFPNQIFWLVITLVVIYLVLTKVALPRVASVLAERSGTITNDLAAAEELKLKAVEAEEAYNKALADARAEAQKIVAEAKAEIQADLDVATQKADAEIAAKAAESEKAIAEIRENAVQSVTEVANETAGALVGALLPQAAGTDVTAAVAAKLKG
ncbi:F0F1 ATP synthase subunit B' [Tropicimonas sp. S265A]|uniref:F0F1 ATP synthase subunit B' n=1 Tax=Tropicimonas sp. S265A TaxID=3415134 RepID=UPI003C7BA480